MMSDYHDQKLSLTESYQGGKSLIIEHYLSLITTFNHAIGLPQKNGQSYPLFDYEQMLFDTLQTNKQVWIKKATGCCRGSFR
jgi:hypothetical protein